MGLWVFAYGSLMWDHKEYNPSIVKRAVLHGAHRSYNRKSICSRGTLEKPGVVLGLEPGGNCVGKALFVDEDKIRLIDKREGVFRGSYHKITTPDKGMSVRVNGKAIPCVVYISNKDCPSYIGDLSNKEKVAMIKESLAGERGDCISYIKETHSMLEREGIVDGKVKEMRERV